MQNGFQQKMNLTTVRYALLNFFQLLDGGNVGCKLFARCYRQVVQIGSLIGNGFTVVRFIFC